MTPFAEIGFTILLGASLGALMTLIRQPPLIGYIAAGVVLGFMGIQSHAAVQFDTMSQLGVTLLLFLVGMELSFTELKSVGRTVLFTGIGQILVGFLGGILLSLLLGFPLLASVYIGTALSFSSTIIVVKLLSEKKALSSLYGKSAVGILLIQDFVAIIILMLLSGIETNGMISFLPMLIVLVKGVLLLYLTLLLSHSFFPYFMRLVSLSPEMVFVTSLAWALGFATFVSLPQIGFSTEIGGFLAGLALANSREHFQIISRIRPLRDFFITIFFIVLGAKLAVNNIGFVIWPSTMFLIFVIVSHSLVVIVLMGLLGYRRRTSFLTGISLSQMSLFGLIIVSRGFALGHLSKEVVSVVTIVAVSSMTISTYLISYSHKLYRKLSKYLVFFERKHTKEHPLSVPKPLLDHIILLGYNRTGRFLLPALIKLKKPIVVVDFNPRVINQLTAEGIEAIYGDMADYEFLDLLCLDRSDMVISTVSDVEDNLVVLERIAQMQKKPLTVVTALTRRDAIRLYEAKAHFVLIPHFVGGEHLAHLIKLHGIDMDQFTSMGERQFNLLLTEWYPVKKENIVRNFLRG